MRHLIRNCGSALAIGGVLAICTAFAQEAPREVTRPNRGRSAPATQVPAQAEAPATAAALPACLEVSKLTAQQRSAIQDILRDYDKDVAAVWKQFSDRYMESVRTEALLLCAIEDNLTDAQQQQVRSQRRRVAQREKSIVGTTATPNQATDKPESAVEEQLVMVGIALTPEQQMAAEKIQQQYLSHLRSCNRDIEGFHTRLVSLEADKFVEIEKVLTPEQLQELRSFRQNAPETSQSQAATTRSGAPVR